MADTTALTMDRLRQAVARGAVERLRALADALEADGEIDAALLDRARGDLDALSLLATAAR